MDVPGGAINGDPGGAEIDVGEGHLEFDPLRPEGALGMGRETAPLELARCGDIVGEPKEDLEGDGLMVLC